MSKAIMPFVTGAKGPFKDGLLVRDSNGDGKLDAKTDTIIGGVNITAPDGASGQSVQSLIKDGQPILSIDTAKMAAKPGKRWGGSMMLLGFKAGNKAGTRRANTAQPLVCSIRQAICPVALAPPTPIRLSPNRFWQYLRSAIALHQLILTAPALSRGLYRCSNKKQADPGSRPGRCG